MPDFYLELSDTAGNCELYLSSQILLQFRLTWAGYGFMFYIHSTPAWAHVLGGLLLITPLMCIPVFMLISLCKVSHVHSLIYSSAL